jgi:hypothetical protein
VAEVTELITRFSFQGSESPLNRYNASLGKGIGLLAGMTAALGAATVAFGRWASTTLQAEQPLINLASQTGVAVEAIQELGFVASVSNSDVQAMNSSLTGLSEKIGEAAQKGSEDFSRLGISVRTANGAVKSTEDILLEVGQRFRQLGLSMAEQQSFAQALGIDPSLLTLLNRSSTEIRSLRNEAREMGILTREQTDQAMQYNDALTTMNFAMDGVRRLVAVGLAPEMRDLADRFTDLVRDNKDWIINGIKATVEGIGNLFDALVRLAPFLGVVAGAFVAAKIATLGFSGALGVLFSPAILIAAGIAAVLLVLDDLIVAFRGGKSVIRSFFLEFFEFDIQPVLQGIVTGFKEVFGLLLDLGSGFITALGGLFSGIGKLITGDFMGAFDDITEAWSILVDTLANAFRSIFSGVFDWIKETISGLIPDWVRDIGSDSPEPGSAAAISRDNSFLPGGTAALRDISNRTEVNVQQNIRTSDPERAGRVAADSLQRQMEDAQTQANPDRGGF